MRKSILATLLGWLPEWAMTPLAYVIVFGGAGLGCLIALAAIVFVICWAAASGLHAAGLV